MALGSDFQDRLSAQHGLEVNESNVRRMEKIHNSALAVTTMVFSAPLAFCASAAPKNLHLTEVGKDTLKFAQKAAQSILQTTSSEMALLGASLAVAAYAVPNMRAKLSNQVASIRSDALNTVEFGDVFSASQDRFKDGCRSAYEMLLSKANPTTKQITGISAFEDLMDNDYPDVGIYRGPNNEDGELPQM